MPFDFKKEYKEFYMPSGKPSIVDVPSANRQPKSCAPLFATRYAKNNPVCV